MDVKKAYEFVRDTPVYGRVKVWHVLIFMLLGPTLTWPMLIILLGVFVYENRNIVKDVKGLLSTYGGSTGGSQGDTQGSTQDQGAPGGPNGREVQGPSFEQRFQQAFGGVGETAGVPGSSI